MKPFEICLVALDRVLGRFNITVQVRIDHFGVGSSTVPLVICRLVLLGNKPAFALCQVRLGYAVLRLAQRYLPITVD